jgi:hypothetical protein
MEYKVPENVVKHAEKIIASACLVKKEAFRETREKPW